MAVTFAIRGDSLTPRYAGTGGKTFGHPYPNVPTSTVDATAIGGYSINQDIAGVLTGHAIYYNGVGNWPATKACSVLLRIKFPSFLGTHILFGNGGACRLNSGHFTSHTSSTTLSTRMVNEVGQTGINNVGLSHTMSTATWYDLLWTFTGDNTSNGCQVFEDGTSLGTISSSRSWAATRPGGNRSLGLGIGGENLNNSFQKVNEFVLWDEIINPASVGLTGGTGSLEGAARTEFVDVAEFDGSIPANTGRVIKAL